MIQNARLDLWLIAAQSRSTYQRSTRSKETLKAQQISVLHIFFIGIVTILINNKSIQLQVDTLELHFACLRTTPTRLPSMKKNVHSQTHMHFDEVGGEPEYVRKVGWPCIINIVIWLLRSSKLTATECDKIVTIDRLILIAILDRWQTRQSRPAQ